MKKWSWLVLVLGTACTESYSTDSGLYTIEPEGLVDPQTNGQPNPVVEQTTTCVSGIRSDVVDPWAPCWEVASLDNMTLVDEDCVLAGEPGTAQYAIQGTPDDERCEDTGVYPTDTVTLTVYAVEALSGGVDAWVEELARTDLTSADGAWPEPLLPSDGERWRVLEGQTVRLYAQLAYVDQVVAWELDQARAWSSGADVVLEDDGILAITVGDAGSTAEVGIELLGERLTIAELQSVSADTLDTLTVAGAIQAETTFQSDGTAPIGARAVFHDTDGEPVFGVPVSWSITWGRLAVSTSEILPGPDYVQLEDACSPLTKLAGERTATVKATYGELTDTVALSWRVMDSWDGVDAELQEAYDPSQFIEPLECTGPGCSGCSGVAGGVGGWLVSLWAGLVAVRRRF